MHYVSDFASKQYPEVNFKFHITSNLYKLPSDFVDYAHKYNLTILCEIAGTPEIHDKLRPNRAGKPTCDKIVKNIHFLIKEGFNINIRATITSHNHDKLLEISKFHKEIGGNSIAYVLLNPVNSDEMIMSKDWLPDVDVYLSGLQQILFNKVWGIDKIFPLNEYIRKIGNNNINNCNCGAPYGNTPTIDVNGNMYPCIYWVGMPKFLAGNVFDEGDLSNISLCHDLQNKLNVENRNDCKNCKWKYICGGGCAVNYVPLLYKFENFNKIDPIIRKYMLKFSCKLSSGCLSIVLWDQIHKKNFDLKNIKI